jgi:hypothetical protein
VRNERVWSWLLCAAKAAMTRITFGCTKALSSFLNKPALNCCFYEGAETLSVYEKERALRCKALSFSYGRVLTT